MTCNAERSGSARLAACGHEKGFEERDEKNRDRNGHTSTRSPARMQRASQSVVTVLLRLAVSVV